MKNYMEVPSIISGKDLDYLSDMFDWNYGAYKNTYNSINSVNDEQIKNILNRGAELFDSNMKQIIGILGGNYE